MSDSRDKVLTEQREIIAEIEKANTAVEKLRGEQYDTDVRIAEIRREAADVAAEDPSQLDERSQPKRKSKLAKLADEHRALTNPLVTFGERITRAEGEVAGLRNRLHEHIAQNCDVFAEILAEEADDAVTQLESALDALGTAAARWSAVRNASADLVRDVGIPQGDPQDLPEQLRAQVWEHAVRDGRAAIVRPTSSSLDPRSDHGRRYEYDEATGRWEPVKLVVA